MMTLSLILKFSNTMIKIYLYENFLSLSTIHLLKICGFSRSNYESDCACTRPSYAANQSMTGRIVNFTLNMLYAIIQCNCAQIYSIQYYINGILIKYFYCRAQWHAYFIT